MHLCCLRYKFLPFARSHSSSFPPTPSSTSLAYQQRSQPRPSQPRHGPPTVYPTASPLPFRLVYQHHTSKMSDDNETSTGGTTFTAAETKLLISIMSNLQGDLSVSFHLILVTTSLTIYTSSLVRAHGLPIVSEIFTSPYPVSIITFRSLRYAVERPFLTPSRPIGTQ